MRILYVEDNMANVALVRRVARGHDLVNYIDGQDALDNFATDQPDLVLMDIQLAGRLTGLDVVKKIREQGYTIPIIAVTAYAMVGDRERCLAAGCDDYMAKPLQVPDLLTLFNKYAVQSVPQPTKKSDDEIGTQPEAVYEHASSDRSSEAVKSTVVSEKTEASTASDSEALEEETP